MHKTIFGRILLAQFTVLLICALIVGGLLFTFVGNYLVGERKSMLKNEAERVIELTVFCQDNPSEATEKFYTHILSDMARRVNGVIFLLDRQGNVLTATRKTGGGAVPEATLSKMFAGEYTALGKFNGFFEETYFLLSEPISYHDTTPAVACAAVPMPRLHSYRTDILHMIVEAIVAAAIVACVLSYFISRRISKPLKTISDAAKRIAVGDFSTEVPVKGNGEIAELGATFNRMTYSLKKLEDMRDGFIAGVSHELRTPMTTISGFIEGILDGTVPPEREKEYLGIVLNETKRLARLVNELLLVARMEDGLKLQKTSFDLCELIRVSLLRFENVFTEKDIRPEINLGSESCTVYADRDAIDRVLINLFDNALKFNVPGGYVSVRLTETERDVSVVVENSGKGIEKEELGMIWDKFYKTDRSRGMDKTGVGLGLYLVRNIISAHGGRITAESEPNRFTRFTFTIRKK